MEFVALACASPTVTIDRLLPLLVLAISLIAPGAAAAQPLSAVGRFKTFSSTCRYTLSEGHEGPCGLVELTRRGPSVLSLRFTGSGPDDSANHQLTFVVIGPAKTIPLHCEGGRCQLSASEWRGEVSSASEGRVDPIGLAMGVPQAWPVQGSCQIQRGQLQCEAKLQDGAMLRAVAAL